MLTLKSCSWNSTLLLIERGPPVLLAAAGAAVVATEQPIETDTQGRRWPRRAWRPGSFSTVALLRCVMAGLSLTMLLAPASAPAQSSGVTKLGVYQDDDRTLVISPSLTVVAKPTESVTVNAGYIADMVSSSSVDLVSAATKYFEERRDNLTLGVAYTTRRFDSIAVAYDWSREVDYLSHTPSVTVGKEFFQRNLVLKAGYAISVNTVGRSGDPGFSEAMTNHSVTLSASQVLSPSAVGRVTYQGQVAHGFQESVYRYVSIYDGGSSPRFHTPEEVPDSRARHATAAVLRQHLGGAVYGQAQYRLYLDSWGIVGHTGGLKLFYEFSRRFHLRLRERLHHQTGADFYRKRYLVEQTYMTSDKELSTLWSSTTGFKIDYVWRPRFAESMGLRTIGLNAKVDLIHIEYAEFEPLSTLQAWVAEVGTSVSF
jgi:hypothetical protein